VALFAFFFSWFYVPAEAILLFFAITGAIFAGWAGIVTIGGLYTRWGTTTGAWGALIVGATTSVAGLIGQKKWGKAFPLNGQEVWALSMGISIYAFTALSLASPRRFNLDKLLHRGEYEIPGEKEIVTKHVGIGWRIFAMGPEFTPGDKVLYIATYAWTFGNIVVFVIGTVINLTHKVSNEAWLAYWEVYVWVNVCLAGGVIVWFGIGGIRDIRRMLRTLATRKRDAEDDGFVREEP
jgi:SSS family solute:Na+ symporter